MSRTAWSLTSRLGLTVWMLMLAGCALAPSRRALEYERALQEVFAAQSLPPTQVTVVFTDTPARAAQVAARLVDEALLYEKDLDGTVTFRKVSAHPQFGAARDRLVADVAAESNLLERTDRMVSIRIHPQGHAALQMYGLAHADGTPKADALYSRHAQVGPQQHRTVRGSWETTVIDNWRCPLFTCLQTGLYAAVDTNACHINNTSARQIVNLSPSINIDGDCLPPVRMDYTNQHPACAAHAHNPGAEDCVYYVTQCTVLRGLGAGNNVALNIGVGFRTVIPTSFGPIPVNASLSLDQNFFTTTTETFYEARLCACRGNPLARRKSENGREQYQEPTHGDSTTSLILDPEEAQACPVATEEDDVGVLGGVEDATLSEERYDEQPSTPDPLGSSDAGTAGDRP